MSLHPFSSSKSQRLCLRFATLSITFQLSEARFIWSINLEQRAAAECQREFVAICIRSDFTGAAINLRRVKLHRKVGVINSRPMQREAFVTVTLRILEKKEIDSARKKSVTSFISIFFCESEGDWYSCATKKYFYVRLILYSSFLLQPYFI